MTLFRVVLIKDSGAYFKGGGTIPWVMATITNFMGLFSIFVFVAYAGIASEWGVVSITVKALCDFRGIHSHHTHANAKVAMWLIHFCYLLNTF